MYMRSAKAVTTARHRLPDDWRKQPASVSVLSARITRLLSQETVYSRILILVGSFNRPPIVEISALLRQ